VDSAFSDDNSHFFQLAEVLAPGRHDLVALIECYFDESERDGLLVVAGYIFDRYGRGKFDKAWHRLLGQYKVPYFHTAACSPRYKPYQHLTQEQCDELEISAIALVKKHALLGIGVGVKTEAFAKFVKKNWQHETPYELAVWLCLVRVAQFADSRKHAGKIAYFFEAGYKHEGKANALMTRIFSHPHLKQVYKYGSHSFVDKNETTGAQAADLLAWLMRKEFMRLGTSKTRRKDFDSLADLKTEAVYADEETISDLAKQIELCAGTRPLAVT
jgi:hypothetical protein